jgi:hypothetical protein
VRRGFVGVAALQPPTREFPLLTPNSPREETSGVSSLYHGLQNMSTRNTAISESRFLSGLKYGIFDFTDRWL